MFYQFADGGFRCNSALYLFLFSFFYCVNYFSEPESLTETLTDSQTEALAESQTETLAEQPQTDWITQAATARKKADSAFLSFYKLLQLLNQVFLLIISTVGRRYIKIR